MEEILKKLAGAGIELIPAMEISTHFVFERGGFVALVERRESGFGNLGAPGILTEQGMAHLVWRGESAFFVTRGWERAAEAEEVTGLRGFAEDLKKSLES